MTSQPDAALGKSERVTTSEQIKRREPIPVTMAGTPIVLDEYDFSHARRGKCVIINNRYFEPHTGQQEREGTDFDASSCEGLFVQMGFEVMRLDNVDAMTMRRTLREVSKEDHSDADCFACVILSHGREGSVYGTDGTNSIDSLTSFFKGDNCRSLIGKPKLFFIQACRGIKFDHGVKLDEDTVDSATAQSQPETLPHEADFLMAYSVVPGYFSWRNSVDGSWFVQAICYVLLEHWREMELVQMMTLVNKIVAYDFTSCTDEEWTDNKKQMPCIMSMLTKQVFFRPKYE